MNGNMTRRSFLQVVGGVAAFALGSFPALSCTPRNLKKGAFQADTLLMIDPDGTVHIVITKSDMGQGVRTSLAMFVAEELDADWSKVKISQAPGDGKLFGGQGTGGSSSVTGQNQHLRQIGATARAMLVAAAAKQWGVEPDACRTESGKVLHPASGRSLGYGELAGEAATMPVPGSVKLKERADFKILGTKVRRLDNRAVVTGKAQYGIDVKIDHMAYAVIARPPMIGAKLESVDDAASRKVPGVLDVIKVNGSVAVLGTHTWAAIQGREALKLTWTPGPNADVNTGTIRQKLVAAVGDHLPMPEGSTVITADYEMPYLAHATMEPVNAVANVTEGACEVWAGTQTPDAAQGQIAGALSIQPDKVIVHTMLLGGGFGRRLANDYIMEAVEVSRVAKRPIKLLWTREDDMQNDMYRPMSHHSIRGAVSGGTAVAFSHHMIEAGRQRTGKFGNPALPYDIAGAQMSRSGVSTPVRTGAWRSVEHSLLSVVNECFIDELAFAAGQDPLQFRLAMIKDARLKKVLQTVADKSGWGQPLPKGTGRGIACFQGYGSYAAHVVELSVADNKVKLHKVWVAIDCGVAFNPLGVEAVAQGGCSDGLSTALRAAITVDKGAIVESNWSEYKWMRMDAAPEIDVTILEGGSPGGMGEPVYPSTPAAVANAVFAATGKRVRKFPIKVGELV